MDCVKSIAGWSSKWLNKVNENAVESTMETQQSLTNGAILDAGHGIETFAALCRQGEFKQFERVINIPGSTRLIA